MITIKKDDFLRKNTLAFNRSKRKNRKKKVDLKIR